MTNLRQAAQQALEAWQTSKYGQPSHQKAAVLAMTNLHIALEQQQSEPVHGDIRALKYRIHELEGEVIGYKRMLDVAEAAPQRKPMTDGQIIRAANALVFTNLNAQMQYIAFARAIEAAHGIKEGT